MAAKEEVTTGTTDERGRALKLAIEKIEKDFGKGAIMRLGDKTTVNVDAIPTGALALDGKIEFLRKIVPGGASKSYGIHVAKMAGLPESVISKSQALMNRMQKDYSKNLSTKKYADKPELVSPQLNLFNK